MKAPTGSLFFFEGPRAKMVLVKIIGEGIYEIPKKTVNNWLKESVKVSKGSKFYKFGDAKFSFEEIEENG